MPFAMIAKQEIGKILKPNSTFSQFTLFPYMSRTIYNNNSFLFNIMHGTNQSVFTWSIELYVYYIINEVYSILVILEPNSCIKLCATFPSMHSWSQLQQKMLQFPFPQHGVGFVKFPQSKLKQESVQAMEVLPA